MRLERLDPHRRRQLGRELASLEADVTYPLGSDSFRIDHGEDYFTFFERLGHLEFFAAFSERAPIGAVAAVKRRVSLRAGEEPQDVWYACDLKVAQQWRGRSAGLVRAAARQISESTHSDHPAYAIAMNREDGSLNGVVRTCERLFASVHCADTLEIFWWDAERAERLSPVIREHRGPLSYLSLAGTKDIVLTSTGTAMPLLHVQHGPAASVGHQAPRSGHVHMLCSPASDPLTRALRAAGESPSATASVLAHQMTSDWRFILTSEI